MCLIMRILYFLCIEFFNTVQASGIFPTIDTIKLSYLLAYCYCFLLDVCFRYRNVCMFCAA